VAKKDEGFSPLERNEKKLADPKKKKKKKKNTNPTTSHRFSGHNERKKKCGVPFHVEERDKSQVPNLFQETGSGTSNREQEKGRGCLRME